MSLIMQGQLISFILPNSLFTKKKKLTNHVFKSFQVWFCCDIKAVISKSVSYTLTFN